MTDKMITQHDAEIPGKTGRTIGVIATCSVLGGIVGWLLWMILH